MITVKLEDAWARAARHSSELGLDTPAGAELLRNKGASRTPEKRGMLADMARRAREAGLEPLPAHPGQDVRWG